MIHSNATQLQAWETFTLVPVSQQGAGWYAIQSINGNYLTAVDSGRPHHGTIHSNATQVQAWEEFYISCRRG